ncbi:gastrokine-1-like [Ambystoma mexicanum]|uniref:gastrokine-1-like n=1 Tax=Ambystoma mexicanum TaxID=8296 RepID=UPI0037E732D3
MKLTICLAALLAVFLTPSLADDSVRLTNQGNDGGSVSQTVNIDNAKNIANINTDAGWNSWNSIWDYNNGFIALRPFAKKSCYIHRMNKNVVPSIQELARLTKEKKDHKGPAQAPPRSLQYSVTSTKADNLNQYGKPIEALCRGVPSYIAQEVQGDSFFAFGGGGCVNAGLLFILDISVCGEGGVQF